MHEKLMETVHNIDKTTTALSVKVNGSINDIERHMESGSAWRTAIVGVMVSIAIQIIVFAYLWGQASRQIAINTNRLDALEKYNIEALKK
jgi:hypothetical protein